jgi:hypothetical protein
MINTLRRATLRHDDAGLSDGQLLERYVRSHDGEAAPRETASIKIINMF